MHVCCASTKRTPGNTSLLILYFLELKKRINILKSIYGLKIGSTEDLSRREAVVLYCDQQQLFHCQQAKQVKKTKPVLYVYKLTKRRERFWLCYPSCMTREPEELKVFPLTNIYTESFHKRSGQRCTKECLPLPAKIQTSLL